MTGNARGDLSYQLACQYDRRYHGNGSGKEIDPRLLGIGVFDDLKPYRYIIDDQGPQSAMTKREPRAARNRSLLHDTHR